MSKQKTEIKPGDVCISSERCHKYGWENRLSLTKNAALRLLKEASEATDPSAPARINKSLTNAQAFRILGGALSDPVGSLVSKNILKQCGVPLKQMKVTAPIEAQKENGQCERDAEVDSKMAEKEAGK